MVFIINPDVSVSPAWCRHLLNVNRSNSHYAHLPNALRSEGHVTLWLTSSYSFASFYRSTYLRVEDRDINQ